MLVLIFAKKWEYIQLVIVMVMANQYLSLNEQYTEMEMWSF